MSNGYFIRHGYKKTKYHHVKQGETRGNKGTGSLFCFGETRGQVPCFALGKQGDRFPVLLWGNKGTGKQGDRFPVLL
ncbi:hypothetical protein UF75_2641 [Desulfosporosinus sp. I2]|nr:hypothetical protein UF75_2641 [Desulfosporosinus sp. I2]